MTTNVVYMFCVYCIYYYVNKFEARSLFSTSHLKKSNKKNPEYYRGHNALCRVLEQLSSMLFPSDDPALPSSLLRDIHSASESPNHTAQIPMARGRIAPTPTATTNTNIGDVQHATTSTTSVSDGPPAACHSSTSALTVVNSNGDLPTTTSDTIKCKIPPSVPSSTSGSINDKSTKGLQLDDIFTGARSTLRIYM